MDALGKNHTYGIAVTLDGIMHPPVTIMMTWVLNVTDVSFIQRTIISLDKKDTRLEIWMIFSVFM